jgi:uncharacterized Zn finger protein (UPF0148 family)
MYCQRCGAVLPAGTMTCPACGFAPAAAPATEPAAPASLEQLLAETKHAAKDLATSTAQLSKRLLTKARTAAKDPSGSAKKVAHRAAKELEAAAREIDRILKDL